MSEHPEQDPFGFFKKFWKDMEQPMSTLMPPLNAADLAKKISELQTIEQWLNMQLSMLKMGIKTLELQQSSLAAMKSMEQATDSSTSTTNE